MKKRISFDYKERIAKAVKFTFRRGTHLNEHKDTAGCATVRLPEPETVSIPLSQHIGAHATPIVAVGDYVQVGQVIGDVTEGLGCPVHASVSGTVKEISMHHNSQGLPVQYVVIENDGKHTWHASVKPWPKAVEETTAEELVQIVRNAGISGLGGATFPTYAKLQSAVGKVQTIIINCAECEPYITSNHRLLLERGETVLSGVDVVMRVLGIGEGIIAIEDNKPDAIKHLQKLVKDGNYPNVRVCVMKTKYPQGDERQLVYALLHKEIPFGKLPADVGCLILNAETTSAISRAFYRGLPLVSRIVTVTGDCVKNPQNVRAPLGASYKELIDFCGGNVKEIKKLVCGGPMMGQAQWNLRAPVIKGTSAILAFSEEYDRINTQNSPCIHCGMCVAHCPMHLMPNYLAQFTREHKYAEAEKLGVMSCVECGTCAYNCPAGVQIVQYIRTTKQALRKKK
ncbi:MAG: electron transport complex subunit RsxC [Clostridia bacterium]|nr:electron transport complex subunit RsxC [Clostridia bacterium]